jgi:hypothetical protein
LQPDPDRVRCVSRRLHSLARFGARRPRSKRSRNTHRSSQRGSYPSKHSPRRQPYRITAALALLPLSSPTRALVLPKQARSKWLVTPTHADDTLWVSLASQLIRRPPVMPPPCSASGTGDHDRALSKESTRRRVPGVQIDARRASRAETRALRSHRQCSSPAPACCHQPGASCRGTLGPNRAEAWLESWRGWVRVTAEAVPPVRRTVARSPSLRVTGRAERLPARTRSPAPSVARRDELRGPPHRGAEGPLRVEDLDRFRRGPSACRSLRLCCIGASRRAHTGVCSVACGPAANICAHHHPTRAGAVRLRRRSTSGRCSTDESVV